MTLLYFSTIVLGTRMIDKIGSFLRNFIRGYDKSK